MSRWRRLAAPQWGVVDIAQLRACGLNDVDVALRVERGSLHPKHRGVYAVGHEYLPLQGRFLAALLACGDGALLSHRAAAAVGGFLAWRGGPIDVLVLDTTTRLHAGIRLHRTIRLQPEDVQRRDGLPVTTPARTLVDLAAVLEYRTLRRATREAQARKRVTHAEIVRTLDAPAPLPRRPQARADPRHRPGPHTQRARGPRSGPPPRCRFSASRRQRSDHGRRQTSGPRLPLARPAPRPRGRRRGVARQPDRPRGRRRAPGAPRGPRRPRHPRRAGSRSSATAPARSPGSAPPGAPTEVAYG